MDIEQEADILLAMEGISKRFPGVQALDNVSFYLKRGEIHALVGENGAGKSTLMKILAGIHEKDSGFIRINGECLDFHGPKEAEKAGVAIIHQELSLFPELSVMDNLFLGREECNGWGILKKNIMRKRAYELLSRFGLEHEITPDTRLGDLSLGRRQEIEILKALGLDARILVMDEPTSALSDSEVERLFQVVKQLSSQGVGIIYITHRLDEIFQLCHRVTVLRDGKLIGSASIDDISRQEIIRMMVGREESEFFKRKPHEPGRELLRVEGASLKGSGDAREWLIKGISFSVREGEVLGIAGLLGAGRTELLECLFGVHGDKFIGRIYIEGEPRKIGNPVQAIEAGLALVTEDRARLGIFANFNVGMNITISSLKDHMRSFILDKGSEIRSAISSIKKWNVRTPSHLTPITALSGGNQQKAILARIMLTNPKIVFLDEPTRGIDVGAKAEIYRRIDDLAGMGLGIVVVTSELPELIALSDRVIVLCEGRLTAELKGEEITPEAIMSAAAP